MYHLPLTIVLLHFKRWIYSAAAQLELCTMRTLIEELKNKRYKEADWSFFERSCKQCIRRKEIYLELHKNK